MAKITGGTGKEYTFGSNGSITVSRPDGTTSTVNKGDANYNSTVNAMGQDGVKYPSTSSSTTSNTTNRPTSNTTSSNTTSSSSYSSGSNSIVPGTGGMTQQQYYTEVQRKQQAGQQLTNPSLYNSIAKKPYVTSNANQTQHGNNTSTHIAKQAGDKGWVSDQYGKDAQGTYVLKGGNADNKVYMTDANKQYFASNYGGTGNFMYDDVNKVTYNNNNSDMRTDSKYNIYGDVGTNSVEKQAMKEMERQKFLSMSPEELAQYKANSTSQLEKNFISSLDGTAFNDNNYNYAPTAIAQGDMQQGLSDLIYEQMRQSGIENFEGLDTQTLDAVLNKAGLSGLFDINQVNDPFLLDQYIQAEADKAGGTGELQIDSKAIMDVLAQSGALKDGYQYNAETGQITAKPGYVQVGDMLMDEGEFTRWYGNQQGQMTERTRQENVDGQYYETPLEMRAKHSPESMNDEMKADLQMERDIKDQLSQLTLQLQYLEQMEGGSGGVVLGGGFGGAGSGSGALGGTNNNANTYGGFGNGGGSELQGITSTGRGAVYGTSQNYTDATKQLLNAIGRRK